MTAEQAIAINNFIDRVHSPYYWSFPVVVAFFFALEIFLPSKDEFLNKFDKYYTHFKFGVISFTTLIGLSQGVTGGCVVQIPQNWLAQQYLGKEYWTNPYGLVFVEFIPPEMAWMLRFFYLGLAFLGIYLCWTYFNKFIREPKSRTQRGVVEREEGQGVVSA